LPVTDRVSAEVVSLPLYRDLDPGAVDRVATLIGEIGAAASR
jgi:dTDP-4-amino-4,6-dideoxygalactose transaminase